MADITVTTLIDENDGIETGGVSLREAINAAASGDQILFDSSLENQTITLTNGELVIAESLTINGDTDGDPETRNITIDADGNSRVFKVDDENIEISKTVTIDGLTITGGGSLDSFSYDSGMGIDNRENLTITNSTVSGNHAANGTGGIRNSSRAIINISNSVISDNIGTDGGLIAGPGGIASPGGIYNSGTATISNSTISGNTSINSYYYGGGGIFNIGLATISDSIISNNSASSLGGGIDNGRLGVSGSNLIVTNSTITGNTASSGGGIYNSTDDASASINNSTISGNRARFGGGISNSNVLDISNSTISGNTAVREGGGIFNAFGTANIISTIIATNTAQENPDVNGNFIDQGDNLIGDTTGSTSFITSTLVGDTDNPIDPLLGPLTDNGGPTPTQALLVGSPGIEAGSNPNEFTTDQRGDGFVREFLGQRADIGAFEFQPDDLPVPLDDPTDLENTAFITDEDTDLTTGNVLSNDIDPVNNGLNITGFDTTLTQGIVTDNSDGTFDYNPDGQFEFLTEGEMATDSFTYTIEDSVGNAGIAPAIVNITIEGVNDTPIVSNPLRDQTAFPSNVFSFVMPVDTFSDIDTGDTLTFNALGLPDWLIFDPKIATFSGVPMSADAGTSNTITVRATDSLGENTTSDFNLTVDGTFTSPVTPPTTPPPSTPPAPSTPAPSTPAPSTPAPSTPTPMIIVPPSSLRVDPSSQIPSIEEPDIEENRNATETIEVTVSLTPTVGTNGADHILGSNAANIIFGQQNQDFIDAKKASDTIHGGQGHDQILGGLGNDSIFGNVGNDTLIAGQGNDWMNGNQGNDFISGEAGLDTIFGGKDNDTLVGGDGLDQVFGNRGEDLIAGRGGNDSLYGGQAGDTVSGNEGNDFVSGDEGSDLLDGNEGQDTLRGGAGNDVIDGGENNDNLDGGDGNDELIGAGGSDTIRGNEGNDRFILSPGDGTDTILDFQNGTDFLVLDGGLTFDDIGLMQEGSNVRLLFNSEVLAVLNGVNIGDITANSFTSTL